MREQIQTVTSRRSRASLVEEVVASEFLTFRLSVESYGIEILKVQEIRGYETPTVIATGGFAAVIFGHSHRPGAELRDGVLFLNPGSAGPRRFSLPVTIARLTVSGGMISHEIVELTV